MTQFILNRTTALLMAVMFFGQHVADLAAFLLPQTARTGVAAGMLAPMPKYDSGFVGGFTVEEKDDRLLILLHDKPVAQFVFHDETILRPYFAGIHAPNGLQVTRNHPPIAGTDAADHDTMHPGLWLGFGDISGNDYWRNKSRIEHLRFTEPPSVSGDRLTFSTESQLLTSDGQPLCWPTICPMWWACAPLVPPYEFPNWPAVAISARQW